MCVLWCHKASSSLHEQTSEILAIYSTVRCRLAAALTTLWCQRTVTWTASWTASAPRWTCWWAAFQLEADP